MSLQPNTFYRRCAIQLAVMFHFAMDLRKMSVYHKCTSSWTTGS